MEPDFRNNTTGEIETRSEILKKHPNTSFPDPLTNDLIESLGYKLIFEVVKPSLNPPYDYAKIDGLEELDGKWTWKYIKVTRTGDDKTSLDNATAAGIRSTRNQHLAESDWTQTRDLTLSNDSAWKTYRQALRDIPAQSGFPHTITWPSKPS